MIVVHVDSDGYKEVRRLLISNFISFVAALISSSLVKLRIRPKLVKLF